MIRKTVIAATSGAVILAGGAAAVAATTASSSSVTYHGCERTSNNREIFDVYSTKTPKCPSGAWQITFNSQGRTGPAGAQGQAGTPTLYESTGNSTPDLAIDMAPGPDGSAGSGGWGWDSSTNKAVTDLTAGQNYTFTTTVIQPNDEQANGSITLTYDPYDFKLITPPSDGTCAVITQTQQETCTFTDLAHSSTSKPWVFQAEKADPDATIGVTAITSNGEATAQFPVQISSGS